MSKEINSLIKSFKRNFKCFIFLTEEFTFTITFINVSLWQVICTSKIWRNYFPVYTGSTMPSQFSEKQYAIGKIKRLRNKERVKELENIIKEMRISCGNSGNIDAIKGDSL